MSTSADAGIRGGASTGSSFDAAGQLLHRHDHELRPVRMIRLGLDGRLGPMVGRVLDARIDDGIEYLLEPRPVIRLVVLVRLGSEEGGEGRIHRFRRRNAVGRHHVRTVLNRRDVRADGGATRPG